MADAAECLTAQQGQGTDMDNTNGLTGILIIIVVVIAIAGGAYNCSGANQDAAVKTARAYAAELHVEVEAISCARMDSDGDGYVGCTIMPKGENKQPMMVECTGGWTFNAGC